MRARRGLTRLDSAIHKALGLIGAQRFIRRRLTAHALKREFGPSAKVKTFTNKHTRFGRAPDYFAVETKEGGHFKGQLKRHAITIDSTSLPSGARGKGHGTRAYRALANTARRRGKLLQSDSNVSTAAQRRYRGLAQDGHEVFMQRGATHGMSRSRRFGPVSVTSPHVFTVRPKGVRRNPPAPKTRNEQYRRVFKLRNMGAR